MVQTTENDNEANSESDHEEDEEDELAANMYIAESDFKFEDFSKRLAHPKVVRACGLALRNFEKNSTLTNHCIVKLLHRIAFDCKMYVMIFQLSIFRTFQTICRAKEVPQFKELYKFAIYIIRHFVKIVPNNEFIFMEALFWKNSRDAYDVEMGYGSYQESNKVKYWTEEEEDEVRLHFMQHQEQQLTEDVVDYVQRNLIDRHKTRRAVLKKLKDMYLLTNYHGPKKSSASASSSAASTWTSEQEDQLREAYERYKDEPDPMAGILGSLEVERPRNRVVDKLLVMGLVQDRKELRKKRSKKSNRNGAQNSDEGGSSSDDNAADDHDAGGDNPGRTASRVNAVRQAIRGGKAKPKAPKKKKKQLPPPKVSRHDLAKQLISLVDNDIVRAKSTAPNLISDFSDALEWIRESLSDALEDMEQAGDVDDDEGVPLVPIMEYSISAMENDDFLRLLKMLGINEPADEQENFWRISGSIPPQVLRAHCAILQEALDKTLVVPPPDSIDPVVDDDSHAVNDSSSDEGVDDSLQLSFVPHKDKPSTSKPSAKVSKKNKNKLDQMVSKKRTKKIQKALALQNVEVVSEELPAEVLNDPIAKKARKSRIQRTIDSDDEADGAPVTETVENEDLGVNDSVNQAASLEDSDVEDSMTIVTSMAGRSRMLLSDSEESDKENEESGNSQAVEVDRSDENKRNRSNLSSDEERPNSKKSRVIDSDDE